MKTKNKYTIDNQNRLVIKRNRKRIVTNGKFTIDKGNRLIYWLNESDSWHRINNLPSKISFEGNWRLNQNHDLELNLSQTKDQYKGNRLVLKGDIISVDNNALAFEIESLDKQGLNQFQLLKLSGLWQADEHNRIIFAVKKKTSPDILTLESVWQINKNQQIIYAYEKTDLKTKTKTSNTLTFEGFWQINNSNKLTYILSRSTGSRFDFCVQMESPNLYPQQGVIKYRLGIGLRQDRSLETKIISLYGAWKFSRNLGLIFQMDYGQNKFKSIEFGTNIYLNKKDEISVSLTNKRNEPLGIKVAFAHRFLKQHNAEAFLRLKRSLEGNGIEAGMRVPF